MHQTVLVTGGSGFIGHYLCHRLLEEEFNVYALSRSSNPSRLINFSKYPNLQILTGDITDRSLMRDLFQTHQFDVVFHLAVVPSESNNKESPETFQQSDVYRTNVLGLTNLIEEACDSGVNAWIQSSSMSVYNFKNPDYLPVDEEHPTKPVEPYGLSKLLGEHICDYYCRKFGINYIMLRYSGVYGGGKNRGVIYNFIRQCASEQMSVLDVVQNRTSDFVFVEDVAEANVQVLNRISDLNGRTFNIGSGTETSIAKLAVLIRDLMDVRIKIKSRIA